MNYNSEIEIKQISDEKDVKIWEKIYPLSFGYLIHSKTILFKNPNFRFYLAIKKAALVSR